MNIRYSSPPRIISIPDDRDVAAVQLGLEGPVAPDIRDSKFEFLGCQLLDLKLTKVVERRKVGDSQAVIGLEGDEWRYCLIPVELSLRREELETLFDILKELPDLLDVDAHELLQDQRIARERVRNVLSNIVVDRFGFSNESLAEIVSKHSVGYGFLESILTDPLVEDVMISSPASSNPVALTTKLPGGASGSVFCGTNLIVKEEQLRTLVTRARLFHGGELSESRPVLELDISNLGLRLSAITRPASPHGLCATFRRRSDYLWTLPRLIAYDSLSWTAAGFLSLCCSARMSIVIAGGRGAGKTTLLTSLIPELPSEGRIIIMEDTQEIPSSQLQKEGLQIQPLSLLGGFERATEVMRAALRLGDGPLIVGEIRGAEAAVLFQSIRTGTAGSSVLGTIHASDMETVRDRIVIDMGLDERSYGSIDVMVFSQQERASLGLPSKRFVSEICIIEHRDDSLMIRPLFTRKAGRLCTINETFQEIGAIGAKMKARLGIEDEGVLGASRMRGFLKRVLSDSWLSSGDDRYVSVRATRVANCLGAAAHSLMDLNSVKESLSRRIQEELF